VHLSMQQSPFMVNTGRNLTWALSLSAAKVDNGICQ
jgi:hypothetical protein